MTQTQSVSKHRTFPPEAFTQHIAILGKTGSGKTTTAKGFAEALIDSGKRVCAIDPTGVWWGLRLKADGKTPGYPVVIFGGPQADVPIEEETSGKRLAEIIAAGSFSSVVDTSLLTVGARTRFFTDFAESLFRANSRPLHLIIDEAHLFAPQGRVPDPQSGRMLHAANNLVSGGRARGLRIMLISQRPAKLHKDSLTQVETLIAMRLIAPQDRDAVEAWIGEWADPKQGRDTIASLPSLPRGDGWVWAPELNLLNRMSFPPIHTFDSSQTPEDGEPIKTPVNLLAVNIESIRDALAVETGHSTKSKKADVSRAEIEAAEKRGYDRGFKEGAEQGKRAYLEAISEIGAIVNQAQRGDCRERPEPEQTTTEQRPSSKHNGTPSTLLRYRVTSAELPPTRTGQPELRILRVLAARHPARFSRAQWATLSRMKKSGGTWLTYMSRLRSAGYIDESDGLVGVTASGLAAAGRVERPSPGSVVQ